MIPATGTRMLNKTLFLWTAVILLLTRPANEVTERFQREAVYLVEDVERIISEVARFEEGPQYEDFCEEKKNDAKAWQLVWIFCTTMSVHSYLSRLACTRWFKMVGRLQPKARCSHQGCSGEVLRKASIPIVSFLCFWVGMANRLSVSLER